MLSPLIHNHRIPTDEASELHVEATPQSWGGNIGLQSFDSLGGHTVVQLTLDQARELAAALSAGADALSKLAR